MRILGRWSKEPAELVVTDLAQQLVPITLPKVRLQSSGWPIQFLDLPWRRTGSTPRIDSLAPISAVRHDQLKSIRRYIERRFLHNHEQCARSQRGLVRIRRIGPYYEIVQDEGVCPVAAAFLRWQEMYDWFFAQRRGRTECWVSEASVLEDADESLWSAKAIALFYDCAATALAWEQVSMERAAGREVHALMAKLVRACGLTSSPPPFWGTHLPNTGAEEPRQLVVTASETIFGELEAVAAGVKCARRIRKLIPPTDAAEKPLSFTDLHPQTLEIWNDAWAGPYESASSVLLKYLCVNPVAVRDWPRLVFQVPASKTGSLLTGRGVIRKPGIAAGDRLIQGTLRFYAPRWRCQLSCVEQLRICSMCIADGYHSLLHQVTNLKMCPVHQIRLKTSCPHCQSPLPSIPNPRHSELPYSCLHCERPLLAAGFEKNWTLWQSKREQIRTKLRPLARWIVRAEQTHRPYQTALTGSPLPELVLPSDSDQGSRTGPGNFRPRR